MDNDDTQVDSKSPDQQAKCKQRLQEAYDNVSRTQLHVRESCSTLLRLVAVDSLQAGHTTKAAAAQRKMTPHMIKMEELLFPEEGLVDSLLDIAKAKATLRAMAEDFSVLCNIDINLTDVINMETRRAKKAKGTK